MDAAKKAFEVQAKVRHDSKVYQNTLHDFRNWEKDIKDKEKELKREVETDLEYLKTMPVRSHCAEPPKINKKPPSLEGLKSLRAAMDANGVDNDPSVEKCDSPVAVDAEKRNCANTIKDRGNQQVKLGNYEYALYEYSSAIEIFAQDPIFYNNRALCYLKLERYEECIDDCERAIEIDKRAVKAYYRRMQANECLGNSLDALKDCTTVLMLEPNNIEAKRSLERINKRLTQNWTSKSGSRFSDLRDDMIDILPIEKPPYKRSTKPLVRVPIAEIVGPKDGNGSNNTNLKISDEDIDKLFNSNCGPFVEVKKTSSKSIASISVAQQPQTEEKEKPTTSAGGKTTKTNSNKITPKTLDITAVATNTTTTTTATAAAAAAAATNTKKESALDSNKISPTRVEKKIETVEKNLAENTETYTRPLPPSPTSTAQFYTNWKELAPAQKYQYLKSIEIPLLCKLLGAGFDPDTMHDILIILRDYYLPNKDPAVAETLLELSKNKQASILSMLMSAEDRAVLSEIMESIMANKANAAVGEMLAKNFDLN